MEIQLYRKRPVIVETVLVTEENADEVAAWCYGTVERNAFSGVTKIVVRRNEHAFYIGVGEYVIHESNGKFWKASAEFLASQYELV